MSNENPTNSREVFDENEAGIAQKKQEMTDAVAAGDYSKVAELAQEAQTMEAAKAEMVDSARDEATEINKGIDEAKAAEEKAAREAALAEQAKLDAEKSQQEAAALLEKMQGGGTESSQENVSLSAEAKRVGESLMHLFAIAERAVYQRDPELQATGIAIRNLDEQTQEKLGQDFFDNTIGQRIDNNRNAYELYLNCFKGTALGRKFASLEDARLKNAGYGGFTL